LAGCRRFVSSIIIRVLQTSGQHYHLPIDKRMLICPAPFVIRCWNSSLIFFPGRLISSQSTRPRIYDPLVMSCSFPSQPFLPAFASSVCRPFFPCILASRCNSYMCITLAFPRLLFTAFRPTRHRSSVSRRSFYCSAASPRGAGLRDSFSFLCSSPSGIWCPVFCVCSIAILSCVTSPTPHAL